MTAAVGKYTIFEKPDIYLGDTIVRGIVFLYGQYIEYYFAPFSLTDGIYGSTFFMATGLHGLHVIVGISALFYCLLFRFFHNYIGVLY
jgi:cytochrome c oxidase subunit 3